MSDLVFSPSLLPNASGYTYQQTLMSGWAEGKFSHLWTLGSRPVSAMVSKKQGGHVWKVWERMPTTDAMLDALEAVGVFHPGSYASCFHQLVDKMPRVKHTYNSMLSFWRGGPWEAALRAGVLPGRWYRYDMISAYRWAGSLGLPDSRTYRACTTSQPSKYSGIWVLEWRSIPPEKLPRAFYAETFVMSSEELRAYRIADSAVRVVRGIRWDAELPNTFTESVLNALPCGKKTGRAYWGRWIARDPLTVHTAKRTWQLPNRDANFAWGWLIVGRVRSKMWQHHAEAAHVYVDEIVLPYELPTGDKMGEWHLKEQYDNGIFVRRTGWFGAAGERHSMRTGHKEKLQ